MRTRISVGILSAAARDIKVACLTHERSAVSSIHCQFISYMLSILVKF